MSWLYSERAQQTPAQDPSENMAIMTEDTPITIHHIPETEEKKEVTDSITATKRHGKRNRQEATSDDEKNNEIELDENDKRMNGKTSTRKTYKESRTPDPGHRKSRRRTDIPNKNEGSKDSD